MDSIIAFRSSGVVVLIESQMKKTPIVKGKIFRKSVFKKAKISLKYWFFRWEK